MRRVKYYIILLMLSPALAWSQEQKQTAPDQKISLSLTRVPFDELVRQVESRLPVHFYYTPEETDRLVFSIECSDLSLDKALTQVFMSAGLSFITDGRNHIFVSRTPLYSAADLAGGTLRRPKRTKRRPFTDSAFAKSNAPDKPTEDRRLYYIGNRAQKPASGKASIAGFVRSSKTGEPVAGATVIIPGTPGGNASTDQFGYFILTAPTGKHVMTVQSIGMGESKKQIELNSDGRFNIDLDPRETTLRTVTVSGKTTATNVRSANMGVQRIDIKTIKQVPVAFGEADLSASSLHCRE